MKKNVILVALFFFSASAAFSQQSIGDQLSNAFAGKSLTVTVMDFVNTDGHLSQLGRYVADDTTAYLVKRPNLKVLERKQIDRILQEITEFDSGGMVREDQIVELGGMLGIDAVVTGTLTRSGLSILINMKIVDIHTGQILFTGRSELRGSQYLRMYNDLMD
jgi:TolB-like protein